MTTKINRAQRKGLQSKSPMCKLHHHKRSCCILHTATCFSVHCH